MISFNTKQRIYTSLLLIFLFCLIIKFKTVLGFSLIVLSVLSFIEFSNISKKLFINKFLALLINLLFLFYIFSFSFFFFILTDFIQYKVLIFIILLGCIVSDIGGFVVGKIFKGPKLTKISPNKTVSGSIGSLVLTCLTMLLIMFFFTKNLDLNFIMIPIITSIFCQLGDLFFSFLKRKVKIKNTGNILPGHGGILDRLDGIYLGLPVGLIFTLLFY
jgi:phosphatidate cytidylyltransferase